MPVFDRVDSHLKGHPEVEPLLPEVFRLVEPHGQDPWAGIVNLGRVVGTSSCLPVEPGESVLYAWRHGRRGCSRFVKHRKPIPCSTVKLVLSRSDSHAILVTAFIGGDVAPEPWSSGAASSEESYLASVEFWRRHALLWDPSLVDESRGVRCEAADYWTRSQC